ncbi:MULTISPECIES: glycoside hydrolase family 30 beta sandwich domain-containing protein [unclassified Xanthomonas]|uniref:glycoside hydrolase family 30 protein n=1 Tax=unclassified Xanthomonas TaxID=2643310 RepID=UPI0016129004|nr:MULTISPECIES: glycoside hydrolase family 30 beta sandwich domain-containing protein [unclassified Xanthomonas]MBB4130701.1 O-glycosyl hydrolase [Xanthomonas sp. 3075]MBB5864462.1 O-glycosyl hydrolase [Xanthomonas sp. 3058]
MKKVLSMLRALTCAMGVLLASQAAAQTVTITPGQTYQTVRGFGGMNGAGWIDDLTPAQVDLAYGSGSGQIGLSILRMRIDPSSAGWAAQVPTATRVRALGGLVFASPWSPPAYMKSNNSLINGGKLLPRYYAAYTTHLLDFANYMAGKGVPLYAISLQNEPDWHPAYESADWSGSDFVNYLGSEGSKFGDLKVIVGESVGFTFSITDPVLNNATANQATDIVAGHLYGATPRDYALARSKGKQVWMTEHYTDNTDANAWPSALGVASELHASMAANFNAYVWWYIRRSYGLIGENGAVSKRGYVMSQFARFVRPGSVRIGATEHPYADVSVTAYRRPDNTLVLVAVNTGSNHQRLDLVLPAGAAAQFAKYSTSSTLNVGPGGTYAVVGGKTSLYLDPQSVTTLVGQ